jgi:hypothetical protein
MLVRPENTEQAIETLRAELMLATGDGDSIDRKAAFIPIFLIALAAFSLGPIGTMYTHDQAQFLVVALVFAFLAVVAAFWTVLPGERSVGPSADEVTGGLGLQSSEFGLRIAASLASAVNDQTARNIERSGRLTLAIILTTGTMALLIAARFAGGPLVNDQDRQPGASGIPTAQPSSPAPSQPTAQPTVNPTPTAPAPAQPSAPPSPASLPNFGQQWSTRGAPVSPGIGRTTTKSHPSRG